MKKKGIIVVFVFGILILIVLIALIFSSIAKSMKGISELNIVKARAYFTAISGIERTQISLMNAFREDNIYTYLSKHQKNEAVKYLSYDEVDFFYKVKVSDENAKINVNWGCGKTPEHPSNKMLVRRLTILGRQLNIEELGNKIINDRGEKCYTLLEDLRHVLGNYFGILSDYLTTTSYAYKNRLVPYAAIMEVEEGMPVYTLNSIYRFREQYFLEERSPININLAPFEILVASLEGLYGLYIDRNFPENIHQFFPYSQKGVPFLPEKMPIGAIKTTTPLSLHTATIIAQQIIEKRKKNPFKNWTDFHNFMNELVKDKIVDQLEKEVIEVNFNPNVHLGIYNPNYIIARNIDKTFLKDYSPEFTFEPMGYFRIESSGEAIYKGKKIGEVNVTRYVRLWETEYYDTQEDFIGQNYNHHNLSGDVVTYPHNITAFYPPSNIDGYIALGVVGREWEKEYKQVSLRASFKSGLVADFATGEKYAKPDIDGYPPIFVDGVYSERYKALIFPIKGKFKENEEKVDTSKILSLYRQTVNIFGSIPMDCSKEVYLYDIFSSMQGGVEGVKKLDREKFINFIKKLEFGSIYGKGIRRLIEHLLEGKEEEAEGLSELSLSKIAVAINKDSDPQKHKKVVEILRRSIENAACIAFVPHTCCFWDIIWGEPGSKSKKDYHKLPYDYDIHFYVGINQIKMLKQIDEKFFETLMVACGAKKGEVPPGPRQLLRGQAYMCEKVTTPPVPDGNNSGLISFWFKPNWGYGKNISSQKAQLILSMTRHSKDIRESIGKYSLSSTCLPLIDDDFFLIDEDGKRILNVWKSAGIQDFYLAYTPQLPNLNTPRKLKFVIDAAFGHEREEYNHKASFMDTNIESGKWYAISVVWDGNKQTNTPYEVYVNNTELGNISFKEESSPEQWIDHESVANQINDGIRFGEIATRFYNANERSIYNPWAWGMDSADATFGEIVTFKEIPNNYKEFIKNYYMSGRYNNATHALFTKYTQLKNIFLLKVKSTVYMPPFLSYTIRFSFITDEVKKSFTLYPRGEIIENIPRIEELKQFSIEFIKQDDEKTLLETPIVDDLHIFYVKEGISIFKEYIDYGIGNE